MKKVLALVLAVMMMATVAFAAEAVMDKGHSSLSANQQGDLTPGAKMKFNDSGLTGQGYTVDKPLNNTNYRIKKTDWKNGRNLVESVTFDDETDELVVKIKQDYTMTSNKTLEGTIELAGKRVGKNAAPHDITLKIKTDIGYELNETAMKIQTDGTVTVPNPIEKKVYKIGKETGADAYGTLDFDADGGEVNVEVRVYEDEKLYLASNNDADSKILKKYADTDADLTFLNFPANPTFSATATVRFYKEEGSYIYANDGNGNLTAITAASAGAAGQTAGNVKWDDDEGGYVLKTRSLGKYVFSDKPLKVSATTTANPDTGANDVVGIATALAAVALVSAAAVSLKK